jgi:diadenosine tetraphosphate (Ap4A) HIT family hydrolase/CTP:molybdopterin cytidylyltransferase MocA
LSGDGEERWVALILAGGKGTRMQSKQAKVLHEIEGKSLLGHVLETTSRLPLARTVVVVGYQAEEVKQRHLSYGIESVLQEPQLGTGHAVKVAAPLLDGEPEGTSLLLLYGDVPLLRETTLRELMERHRIEGNGVTVLTARVSDPTGYGRIVRGPDERFQRIVEERDLGLGERSIDEINSGIYAFQLKSLLRVLHRLRAENAQGEYYLTDTLSLLLEQGLPVGVFLLSDPAEIAGINTVAQLTEATEILRRRAADPVGQCVVCSLLRDRSELILERTDGMAVLLAPSPYNCGHLWVVPERHVVHFESLRAVEASRMLELGAEAERWLDQAYRPQAMNLGYNSGRSGEHLALQVIPRWAGDSNFMPLIGGVNILPETPSQTLGRLQEARRRIEGKP